MHFLYTGKKTRGKRDKDIKIERGPQRKKDTEKRKRQTETKRKRRRRQRDRDGERDKESMLVIKISTLISCRRRERQREGWRETKRKRQTETEKLRQTKRQDTRGGGACLIFPSLEKRRRQEQRLLWSNVPVAPQDDAIDNNDAFLPFLHRQQVYHSVFTNTTSLSQHLHRHNKPITVSSQTQQAYHSVFTDTTSLSQCLHRHNKLITVPS